MTVKSLDTYRTHRRSLKGARILVVDDEATVRMIIQQFLENTGFTVTVASSGEEALHCFDNDQFDLMLLDIVMPDTDGFKVLEAVRQKNSKSQLLIIMVTVKEDSADLLKAFSLGANDYIIKPIDFTVLRARIEMHLSHQRAENELRETRNVLEQSVEERTAELLATNKALVSEIAERKQAEQALHRIHALHQQAEQMGHLGHWEWDVVTDKLIVCSDQYAHIFEMTVDQVFATLKPFEDKVDEFIHEDDRERYKQVTEIAYERKEGWDIEFRIITLTGKVSYVHELGEPAFNEHGTLVRTFGTLQDITEYKRVEEELRESRNFLNAIIEGAPDFIFAKDLNGRYTMVNNAYAKAVGKSMVEILGKTNSDLFSPDNAKALDLEDQEVLTSGKTHSYENQMEIDGSKRTLSTTKYIHFDSEGNAAGVLAISHDITDRKMAEEEIRHLANHDELTGLPTLRLGKDRFSSAIALARRNKTNVAVLYVDLDSFKEVNDRLGHKAGDQVLIEVAKRLTQSVRETDTVARLGGDEFNIVLAQATKKTDCMQVAEKVIKTLTRPIRIDDQEVNISASIGIALFPEHGGTPEALINKADEAMYVVKREGKNNYRLANDDI